MNKHVPEDGGTVRSSGYGLMVVKTTDSAADAEQIALSGASRRLPTPKSVRHGAVGAQNRRRHPPRPPGKAAASLRTISANIYIYTRQEQQMGQDITKIYIYIITAQAPG